MKFKIVKIKIKLCLVHFQAKVKAASSLQLCYIHLHYVDLWVYVKGNESLRMRSENENRIHKIQQLKNILDVSNLNTLCCKINVNFMTTWVN